ncbi:YybH family protein [Nocardia xishanensis]|uniref:YybH family protein n=1 Tax=Nocardia xishanensis TaxID=238964 RepID=UPI00341A82B3
MTVDHGDFTEPTHAELLDFVTRWAELFNHGDLAALDRLYEPDAISVPTAGQPMQGLARSAATAHLRSYGLPLRVDLRHCYVVGDIALLILDWSMTGTTAQGYPLDLRGSATDIVRRSEQHRWRYVIDNPFGTA